MLVGADWLLFLLDYEFHFDHNHKDYNHNEFLFIDSYFHH